MAISIQVTFRDMPICDALEALCWTEAEAIERDLARLRTCRVVIASGPATRRPSYSVGVELAMPGREVAVGHDAGERREHDDAAEAIRAAFAAMRRRIAEDVDGAR